MTSVAKRESHRSESAGVNREALNPRGRPERYYGELPWAGPKSQPVRRRVHSVALSRPLRPFTHRPLDIDAKIPLFTNRHVAMNIGPTEHRGLKLAL